MRFIPCRIVLVLALLVVACGGGGSGSGGDASNEGFSARSLLVRWRTTEGAAGYVIHWGMASADYTHAIDVGAPEPDDDGVVSFLLDEAGVSGSIYVALTSYDEAGQTSSLSNELAVFLP